MSEYPQARPERPSSPIVVLRLPAPMLEKIDDHIDRGQHLSRSEAIRFLINKALKLED